MDDCTPTSSSSCAGISPSIQSESIHPTLFEYLRVIQRGDTEVEESSHIHATESASSREVNGLAPSGGAPSAPTSLEDPTVLTTDPSPSSSQQASGPSWPGFETETTQTLFDQGTAMQSVAYPFDSSSAFNSIFRLQHPEISAQYPQLSDGVASGMQRAPTVGPSLSPDNTSGSIGISTIQMGDPNARDTMDFARYMAESVPGLVYDGSVLGWDTFLTGWQPHF